MIIRPMSDLRNHFSEISKTVQETAQPIFLTKNGHGNMVVMSMDAYQKMKLDLEIHHKLLEAEAEMKTSDVRYTSEEVFAAARAAIQD